MDLRLQASRETGTSGALTRLSRPCSLFFARSKLEQYARSRRQLTVARPKIPLISRDSVLDLALRIIDREGLDALSVRRIGEELGVNSASLYHHFQNKHDIVVSAAELALLRTPLRLPTSSVSDWRELLLLGSQQLRDFLLSHPELT